MIEIPDCRITGTDVIIGGYLLPHPIRDGSVVVTPTRDGNIVTVEFIVGEVTVEER